MIRQKDGSDSEVNSSKSSEESSQRLKLSPSLHEQGEMGAFQYLRDSNTEERNHRRMEAAGNAQMKEQYPNMEKPEDEMIQWHSPTTHYHQAPEKQAEPTASQPAQPITPKTTGYGKAAVAAGLLATGAGLGTLGLLALDVYRHPPKPAAVVDTDTNTQYGLRLFHE